MANVDLLQKVDIEWRACRLQATLEGLAVMAGDGVQKDIPIPREGLHGLFDILAEEAEVIAKAVSSLPT